MKKRLENAEEKKKALEKDLLDAQKQLNDVKRGTSEDIMRLRLCVWNFFGVLLLLFIIIHFTYIR